MSEEKKYNVIISSICLQLFLRVLHSKPELLACFSHVCFPILVLKMIHHFRHNSGYISALLNKVATIWMKYDYVPKSLFPADLLEELLEKEGKM